MFKSDIRSRLRAYLREEQIEIFHVARDEQEGFAYVNFFRQADQTSYVGRYGFLSDTWILYKQIEVNSYLIK